MKNTQITRGNSHTIKNTYNEAKKFRAKYPLPHGKFKLVEAHRELDDIMWNLKALAQYSSDPNGGFEATCCMPNDYKQWVNSVPTILTYLIGMKIEPAVYALQEDETDPRCVATIKDYITQTIPKLLSDLERARMTKASCEHLIVLAHRVRALTCEVLTCTRSPTAH
tara:strand:+ start:26756 stop:27256 length:501 start_codon:yes stop_codon:yes gene_type:complete